jgi:hypothetical protein
MVPNQTVDLTSGRSRYAGYGGLQSAKEDFSMAKKTVPFNEKGIKKLPDNKPVIYKILTDGDRNNYTGVAQRGRVQERLKEHLPGREDYIPGAKVQIEQMSNIKDAEAKEARIIARAKPPHNEQGK